MAITSPQPLRVLACSGYTSDSPQAKQQREASCQNNLQLVASSLHTLEKTSAERAEAHLTNPAASLEHCEISEGQ